MEKKLFTDEEALQASRFRNSNKPWIDVPDNVQEQRRREGACILCGEKGHFISDCPKRQAMGRAVWTIDGEDCDFQFTENDSAI